MSEKTPSGQSYDFWEPGEMPERPVYVVLEISGMYSGISWAVKYAAQTWDAAIGWIDAHPVEGNEWNPIGYEIQVAELGQP